MQEGALEAMDTLWPYCGFSVRAFERKLGEGKLTLTDQSLLFEPKDGFSMGFDFTNLRLVRLRDVHSVEVAYSIQGELRNSSLRIVCTFTDGTEKEELPGEDDPYRMSLFRAITGGVVARLLADRARAKEEGLTRMKEEKFESRIKDLKRNISLFPDKKEYEENTWRNEELRKRSLEAAESEPEIWDDPYRDRLFYTGANPTMAIDNAFEKLDMLQDDWVNGRMNPLQRARCVAMDYAVKIRMFEMGYTDSRVGPVESWKASAEKLARFEKTRLGVDILSLG